MALVLGTTLKLGADVEKAPPKSEQSFKIVEEGTPYNKLTKKEKELAKDLNLLVQAPDEEENEPEPEEEDDSPSLQDELAELPPTEAEKEAAAEAEDTEGK